MKIPEEVMIVGGSGSAAAGRAGIALSSVRLPHHGLGYAGAAQAHKLLCGTRPDPLIASVPAYGIIERDSTVPRAHSTDPVVDRAFKRIAREDRPIPSVADLAKHCRVHRQVLLLHFRKELGQPPKTYIKERAMRRASRLLAETELPMAQIAKQCGYTHRTKLTRAFKERFGVAPVEYRRRVRGA